MTPRARLWWRDARTRRERAAAAGESVSSGSAGAGSAAAPPCGASVPGVERAVRVPRGRRVCPRRGRPPRGSRRDGEGDDATTARAPRRRRRRRRRRTRGGVAARRGVTRRAPQRPPRSRRARRPPRRDGGDTDEFHRLERGSPSASPGAKSPATPQEKPRRGACSKSARAGFPYRPATAGDVIAVTSGDDVRARHAPARRADGAPGDAHEGAAPRRRAENGESVARRARVGRRGKPGVDDRPGGAREVPDATARMTARLRRSRRRRALFRGVGRADRGDAHARAGAAGNSPRAARHEEIRPAAPRRRAPAFPRTPPSRARRPPRRPSRCAGRTARPRVASAVEAEAETDFFADARPRRSARIVVTDPRPSSPTRMPPSRRSAAVRARPRGSSRVPRGQRGRGRGGAPQARRRASCARASPRDASAGGERGRPRRTDARAAPRRGARSPPPEPGETARGVRGARGGRLRRRRSRSAPARERPARRGTEPSRRSPGASGSLGALTARVAAAREAARRRTRARSARARAREAAEKRREAETEKAEATAEARRDTESATVALGRPAGPAGPGRRFGERRAVGRRAGGGFGAEDARVRARARARRR